MADPKRNPFPGMNPWLEWRWPGVHARLVTYIADALAEALPPDLQAKVEERVFVEAYDAVERTFRPDAHVHEDRRGTTADRAPDPGAAAVATASASTPILLRIPRPRVTETSIAIVDLGSGGRVVTVLEVVSQANKVAGQGRRLYLRKVRDAERAGTSVVEIDLLRSGRPVTRARRALVPDRLRAPYHACVGRAGQAGVVEYYPAPLRARLPTVRVPLRAAEPDAPLDLQPLLDRAYEMGRYHREIDYSVPPERPLTPVDAAWAAELLRGSGLLD